MNEILQFAQTVSPLGIIALLVIVIFQLINGKGILSNIRGTQKEKYPEITEHFKLLQQEYKNLKKFQENHSMHEIPDIVKKLDKMDSKLDEIAKTQTTDGNRLTKLETLVIK